MEAVEFIFMQLFPDRKLCAATGAGSIFAFSGLAGAWSPPIR
jgi:hypothetical protein